MVLGEGGLPIYGKADKDGTDQRGFELICPADLPLPVSDKAKRMALQAFVLLGCRDWSRVEFRLDETPELGGLGRACRFCTLQHEPVGRLRRLECQC